MTRALPMNPSLSSGAVPRIAMGRGVPAGSPLSLKATRFDAVTTVAAWLICIVGLAACVVSSRAVGHWFIIPVFFCGIIVAHDMVDWFRGRFDVFDPMGLFGVFGFFFFFLNPMLHVVWDIWIVEPRIRPDDMRPWLGWMACLNFLGLLIYRYLRDPLAGRVKPNRKAWIVEPGRFWMLLPILLVFRRSPGNDLQRSRWVSRLHGVVYSA